MKAQWTEGDYGFWYLRLPWKFSVVAGWEKGGYRVSFGEHVVKQRFTDLDAAKKAGERFALRILNEVTEILYE
jgi:hypothetical protein